MAGQCNKGHDEDAQGHDGRLEEGHQFTPGAACRHSGETACEVVRLQVPIKFCRVRK